MRKNTIAYVCPVSDTVAFTRRCDERRKRLPIRLRPLSPAPMPSPPTLLPRGALPALLKS